MISFKKEIKTGMVGKYIREIRVLGIPFDIKIKDGPKTMHWYFFGLFKKIKSDHEKQYCILGLPVYRTINDANRVEQRLLGISLHKLKKNKNRKKTYILGFQVRVKKDCTSSINAQISLSQKQISKEITRYSSSVNSQISLLQKQISTETTRYSSLVSSQISSLQEQISAEITRHSSSVSSQISLLQEQVSAEITHYSSSVSSQISALQDSVSAVTVMSKSLLLNSCAVAQLHQKTFSEYKNMYQGREMVLLASGPTNCKYGPIAHAIHVGVDRSFLKDDVKLDYLFVQDKRAFNGGYQDSIIQYRGNDCKKFFGILSDRFSDWIIPESWSLRARAARYYTSIGLEERFAYDLSCQYVGDFGSAVYAALQFMLWCNPKRIYLVGCDCSNSPYAHDNSKVTDPTPKELIGNYVNLKRFADVNYPDTEIISVNPVGLKGIFKDVYTNEYISEHTEIKDAEILKQGAETGKKKALLVMAATGNYLFSVGNVLLGLKRHSPLMFDDIVVYTDQTASDEDKKVINKISPVTFKIYDYQLPNLADRKRLAYYSNMPYARFEMLTYLDRYEKVMWFDSDFLITGDISGLLNYGKTGLAMSIDLDPYPGGHGVGRFFVKDVPGYDMTAAAYASGLVIFSDHLANPLALRKYLYRQLEKYSSYVRYAEQGILQLMIEDFGLQVDTFPKLTYHVFPWEDKRNARLFHLLGKYKPWVVYAGAYSDEWYENHEIWISLGGSEAYSFVPLMKKYAKVYSSTSFSNVLYLDIPHHDRRYQSILLADYVNKCLMT